MLFNMGTLCVFTIVTWSLTLVTGNDGYHPTQYYMNSLCKQKLLHKSRNALIMSPWTNNFPPSTQMCTMGVEESAHHIHQFVITFNTMGLHEKSEGTCIKSRLDMFNGQSLKATDRINGDQGLCGSNTEKSSYETTTAFLTLKYETSGLPANHSQSFEAVITPFHYGECKHDEFKCSNAKCIHTVMRCDSYNNCGDGSDEKNCSHVGLSIAGIVGIVLGSVALVALVVGFLIAVCCCGLCNLYDRM